jgi:predicted RNA-binding protein YlxR (DUF448 family)
MKDFEEFIRKMLEENLKFFIFEIKEIKPRGCCVCNQMKPDFEFPQLFKNINICNSCIANFDAERLNYLRKIFEKVQKEHLYENLDELGVKIDKKDYILMKKNPKIEIFLNKGGEYDLK